jgi:hypothetical protein
MEKQLEVTIAERASLLTLIGSFLEVISGESSASPSGVDEEDLERSFLTLHILMNCRGIFSRSVEDLNCTSDFIDVYKRFHLKVASDDHPIHSSSDLRDVLSALAFHFDSLSLSGEIQEYFLPTPRNSKVYLLQFLRSIIGFESGLSNILKTFSRKIQDPIFQQLARNIDGEFVLSLDESKWNVMIQPRFPQCVTVMHSHCIHLTHRTFGEFMGDLKIQITLDPSLFIISAISCAISRDTLVPYSPLILSSEDFETFTYLITKLTHVNVTRAEKKDIFSRLKKLKPK